MRSWTDNERLRHIASNLEAISDSAGASGVPDEAVFNALEIGPGAADYYSNVDDVLYLAYDIDIPLCHLTENDGVARCSVCGATFEQPYETWNYCPNCGAEIQSEQDW